jgi:hypothetical protein
MQDPLEEIDADYYRAARLLIVRAELEQLRRGSSTAADALRRSKLAYGGSSSIDRAGRQFLRAATAQSVSPEIDTSG